MRERGGTRGKKGGKRKGRVRTKEGKSGGKGGESKESEAKGGGEGMKRRISFGGGRKSRPWKIGGKGGV